MSMSLPRIYDGAVSVCLPFDGPALVQMSPSSRIPSHGSESFATRYSIDFVPCEANGRTSRSFTWRTVLTAEDPGLSVGFGKPLLSPADGTVVRVHNGEPDHESRRSLITLIPYALGQPSRIRQGAGGLAGNYVVIRLDHTVSEATRDSSHLLLAHCKDDSFIVSVGEHVIAGQQIAQIGNSGNSTAPHVHVQLMDGPDGMTAQGLPLLFSDYEESVNRGGSWNGVNSGIPNQNSLVRAVPVN